MVSQESVEKQLKRINFNLHGWGRTEALELKNILLEGEEIYEVVNGIYEGGFAMLVATDIRVLLIDKKPMNYLTIEDMRFDMINEIDYYHRLLGAHTTITSGEKKLKLTSYNQPKLRKVISHIQHCMAENKKEMSGHQIDQKQHLEQINQQLQAYLLAQHQQQEKLTDQLLRNNDNNDKASAAAAAKPESVRPSNELSDYLFAQSLLAQYKAANGKLPTQLIEDAEANRQAAEPDAKAPETPITLKASATPPTNFAEPAPAPQPEPAVTQTAIENRSNPQMSELYAEGMQEIFGKRGQLAIPPVADIVSTAPAPASDQYAQSAVIDSDWPVGSSQPPLGSAHNSEVNAALKIAYSKLPMALRNRRFGRPSFHSHSRQQQPNIGSAKPVGQI